MVTNKKSTIAVFGTMVLMGSIFFLEGCGAQQDDVDVMASQDDTNVQETAQVRDGAGASNRGVGAQEGEQMGEKEAPTEMIDACSDKAEGDACEAIIENAEATKSMTGTCMTSPRNDDVLVCVSEDMQRGPGGAPSQKK